MEVHIIIDYTKGPKNRRHVRVFGDKKSMFDDYVKDLKENFTEAYSEILGKLYTSDASEIEIIRAFEGKPYNADLICMQEYLDEYDCDTSYYLRTV